MTEREIIEQRIRTLDGLLQAPGGPLGAAGGQLADRLSEGWRAEQRLLNRILDESKGKSLRATISLWQERTSAFAESSDDERPSWRDREGNVWDAIEVLRILEDLDRRLEAWMQEQDRLARDELPPPDDDDEDDGQVYEDVTRGGAR